MSIRLESLNKNRTIIRGIFIIAFIAILFIIMENNASENSRATIITVDKVDPGADYTTISDAVNNAADGDTIIVNPGTYDEHINIDKKITLKGIYDYKNSTVITYNQITMTVSRAGVSIENLTIKSTGNYKVIDVYYYQTHIINCNIVGGSIGINLNYNSNRDVIDNCSIYDQSYVGIYLDNVKWTYIQSSLVKNATYGIYIISSNSTVIKYCTVSENIIGISYPSTTYGSYYNEIESNTIKNNHNYGIYMNRVKDSVIQKNRIIENNIGVFAGYDTNADESLNYWGSDNGPYSPVRNPEGTGNAFYTYSPDISYLNNFKPWLDSNMKIVTGIDYYVSKSDYRDFNYISDAFNVSTPFSTINIVHGDFHGESLIFDNRHDLTLKGNGNIYITNMGTWWFSSTYNITIDGLTFINSDAHQEVKAISFEYSNNISINNCSFIDFGYAEYIPAIKIYLDTNISFNHCSFQYIPYNTTSEILKLGTIIQADYCKNLTLNDTFFNNLQSKGNGTGIHITNTEGITITNNQFNYLMNALSIESSKNLSIKINDIKYSNKTYGNINEYKGIYVKSSNSIDVYLSNIKNAYYGMIFENSNFINITNCTINSTRDGITINGDNSNINNTSINSTANGITINGDHFYINKIMVIANNTGIYSKGNYGNISNTTIKTNNSLSSGYGINVELSSYINITDCEIYNFSMGIILFNTLNSLLSNNSLYYCGIMIEGTSSSYYNNIVENCKVDGKDILLLNSADSISIYGNYTEILMISSSNVNIYNTSASMVFVADSQNINIFNSTIGGKKKRIGYGTCIYKSDNVNIFNSVINYTKNGIYLLYVTNSKINYNNICSNTDYGVYSNHPIDAKNNWWGSDTGPKVTGNGDRINDYVEYVPYLTEWHNVLPDMMPVPDAVVYEDTEYSVNITAWDVDGYVSSVNTNVPWLNVEKVNDSILIHGIPNNNDAGGVYKQKEYDVIVTVIDNGSGEYNYTYNIKVINVNDPPEITWKSDIYNDVVLNEIRPYLDDGYKDYIEIYNPTEHSIDLSGYRVWIGTQYDILSGVINPKDILYFGTNNFTILYQKSYDIYLKNSNGVIIDSVTTPVFNTSQQDNLMSFSRIPDGSNHWEISHESISYINTPGYTYNILMNEGDLWNYNVTIKDVDNSKASLIVKWFVDGIEKVIDTADTGENFSYAFDYYSAGKHNITVEVKDNEYTKNFTWSIYVKDKPYVPAFYTPISIQCVEDTYTKLNLSNYIHDEDTDIKDINITTNAGNFDYMSVYYNETTYELVIIMYNDAEDTIINLTANDGINTNSTLVNLKFIPVNDPPEILSYSPGNLNINIHEDQTVVFQLSVQDVDSYDFTYSWYSDDNLIHKSNSNYSYEYDFHSNYISHNGTDAGNHVFRVVVSDGEFTDEMNWTVNINNVNRRPEISAHKTEDSDAYLRVNEISMWNSNRNDFIEIYNPYSYDIPLDDYCVWVGNGLHHVFPENSHVIHSGDYYLLIPLLSNMGTPNVNISFTQNTWVSFIAPNGKILFNRTIIEYNGSFGYVQDGTNETMFFSSPTPGDVNNNNKIDFLIDENNTLTLWIDYYDPDFRFPDYISNMPTIEWYIDSTKINDSYTSDRFNYVNNTYRKYLTYYFDMNSSGLHHIYVVVKDSDNHNLEDRFEWSIMVNNINRPPVIKYLPDKVYMNENETKYINFIISDSDDEHFQWDLYLNKTGIDLSKLEVFKVGSFININCSISIITDYESAGPYDSNAYNITLSVMDDHNAIVNKTLVLYVNNTNRAPVINSTGMPEYIKENGFFNYKVDAYDPDTDRGEINISWFVDDIYTYSGKSFVYHPDFNASGHVKVLCRITDSDGYVINLTKDVIVENVNRIGYISTSTPGNVTIDEGEEYNFTINYYDPDCQNNIIVWFLDSNMVFEENGTVSTYSFTANYSLSGEHSLIVMVYDGNSTVMKTFNVNINNVNREPVISLLNFPQIIDENTTTEFIVEVSDPDTDDTLNLNWFIDGKKVSTIKNDNIYKINFVTDFNSSGEREFLLELNDGHTIVREKKLVEIRNVNRPPVIVFVYPDKEAFDIKITNINSSDNNNNNKDDNNNIIYFNLTYKDSLPVFGVDCIDYDGDNLVYEWFLNNNYMEGTEETNKLSLPGKPYLYTGNNTLNLIINDSKINIMISWHFRVKVSPRDVNITTTIPNSIIPGKDFVIGVTVLANGQLSEGLEYDVYLGETMLKKSVTVSSSLQNHTFQLDANTNFSRKAITIKVRDMLTGYNYTKAVYFYPKDVVPPKLTKEMYTGDKKAGKTVTFYLKVEDNNDSSDDIKVYLIVGQNKVKADYESGWFVVSYAVEKEPFEYNIMMVDSSGNIGYKKTPDNNAFPVETVGSGADIMSLVMSLVNTLLFYSLYSHGDSILKLYSGEVYVISAVLFQLVRRRKRIKKEKTEEIASRKKEVARKMGVPAICNHCGAMIPAGELRIVCPKCSSTYHPECARKLVICKSCGTLLR